jgi:hypothetical protein
MGHFEKKKTCKNTAFLMACVNPSVFSSSTDQGADHYSASNFYLELVASIENLLSFFRAFGGIYATWA